MRSILVLLILSGCMTAHKFNKQGAKRWTVGMFMCNEDFEQNWRVAYKNVVMATEDATFNRKNAKACWQADWECEQHLPGELMCETAPDGSWTCVSSPYDLSYLKLPEVCENVFEWE